MINKSVEQSQTIRQINRNNRDFIYNSVYTNEKKLMCVSCEKLKKECYINKCSSSSNVRLSLLELLLW